MQDTFQFLEQEKQLIFYKIMKYPVPREAQYFLFDEKERGSKKEIQRIGQFQKTDDFSRNHANPYMEEYIRFVKKYSRLYKSIPFLQSIYIGNSMSFNALHENSDIDLFIVTKPGALRRARFFSEIYFRLFFLKRGLHHHQRKKFCLSFYVTQDRQDLYNIMLPKNDIYFIYWLAHLVPIYQETFENIYKHNRRLESVLPNFPGKHTINIGLPITYGKSKRKKLNEFLFGGLLGKLIEIILKLTRIPLVIYKRNRLGKAGKRIIINRYMLKFHADAREKIHLMYELYLKRYKEKKIIQS